MTLLEKIDSADPKILLLSRKNSTAFNVSAIILSKSELVFFGWPGHDFGGGDPDVVGRDGHALWRFDFQDGGTHPFLDKYYQTEKFFKNRGEIIEHATDFISWFKGS